MPKPKGVVGGSNLSCVISLDGKLAPSVSKKRIKKKHSKFDVDIYSEWLCKLIIFATLAIDFHRNLTLGLGFEKLR